MHRGADSRTPRTAGANSKRAVLVLLEARSITAGTLMRLPESLMGAANGFAGRIGYKGHTGPQGSHVLVPGRGVDERSARSVILPPTTDLEIIATPMELANAYLSGRLARIDRRWRVRTSPAGVAEIGAVASEGDSVRQADSRPAQSVEEERE